jgi:hypothetical protein
MPSRLYSSGRPWTSSARAFVKLRRVVALV